MTTKDTSLLAEQGVSTDWVGGFRPQQGDGTESNSTEEALPSLLRKISTGSFPFIAKDSPDESSLSWINLLDLESGNVSTDIDDKGSTSHVIGLEGNGDSSAWGNLISPLGETSDEGATLDRLQMGKVDIRDGGSLTPRSILAKPKSPGIPSTPKAVVVELAKKVSFGSKTRTCDTNDAARSVAQTPLPDTAKQGSKRRFFSQPMPASAKHSSTMNGSHAHSGPVRRCVSQHPERNKEGNYLMFKTRSAKFERQISRLQFKHQREEKESCNEQGKKESSEGKAMPAGRYFDALRGPELEILKDSEELLLPLDQRWPFLLRFPIGCFGICLGLGSQTILWKALATSSSMSFLHIPLAINLALWFLALFVLVSIFSTYSLKCLLYFEAVRREYYHPVRINFFFAPWIACMFLTLGIPPRFASSVHPVLWCIFMTPIFLLELKIYGQWLSGGDRRLSKVANPSTHLSLVGNFVGALLAATVGWKEPAIFFWAVGCAHYLVLFVTLYQRLPTAEALPKELHPVFFLFVAAPCTASVAWKYIGGDFDYVSRIAYFVGLFLYSSLVVRLNFFRGFRFSVAWWAYTFPMTLSAIATIHYSLEIRHPITQFLAVLLSFISVATVCSLFIATILHGVFWRSLFPNDIAIAITNRRHKRKNKGTKLETLYGSLGIKGDNLSKGSILNMNSVEGHKLSSDSPQNALLTVESDPLPVSKLCRKTAK